MERTNGPSRNGHLLGEVRRRELLGEEPLEAGRVAADPLVAQVVARGVRGDIRAPQRVGDEADRLLRARPRSQRPLHGVLDRFLRGSAARVDEQRDVSSDVGERPSRFLDAAGNLRVVRHAGAFDVLRDYLLQPLTEQHLVRELRDALRDERRRSPDHERGLLQPTALDHVDLLLPCMLRVMPWVRLVRGELEDEVRDERGVRVDGDPAAQGALVVVERGPRLVRDVLDLDGLALGKPEQVLGSLADVREHCVEDRGEGIAVERIVLTPDLVALGERAVPRKRVVELSVSGFEQLLGDPFGAHAVAAFDLVLVGHVFAGELARDGLQAEELRPDPVVVGLREERTGVLDERAWVAKLLRVDALLDLGRPVVRVDEPVDVPAQTKAELEVALAHRSKRAACPWPTPTQSVASPYFPPRRLSSWSSVTTSRAPLIPRGCPSAIAPPLTFTFSGSRPSSRITTRLCEAKASFSSTRSRSETSIPARSSSFRTAGTGPIPITRGSTPATALPTKAPSGSTPSAWARSSLAITRAAAPSLMPLELPAVTVPPSLNAGLSVASFSRLVSGRGCSSRATSPTGTSSSSKRPLSLASVQRRCDCSPNSSCSSRLIPYRSATFSPVSPIDSSGNISSSFGFGKRQPSVVSQIVWLPRWNARSGFAITRGARVIDSTPPATKRSPSPATTACEAETTAERPDAQRRLTVTPATDSGSPARSAAIRATFRLSSPAWFAAPK